jgi:hypothetical protein
MTILVTIPPPQRHGRNGGTEFLTFRKQVHYALSALCLL